MECFFKTHFLLHVNERMDDDDERYIAAMDLEYTIMLKMFFLHLLQLQDRLVHHQSWFLQVLLELEYHLVQLG
jgi:hypothetical protein